MSFDVVKHAQRSPIGSRELESYSAQRHKRVSHRDGRFIADAVVFAVCNINRVPVIVPFIPTFFNAQGPRVPNACGVAAACPGTACSACAQVEETGLRENTPRLGFCLNGSRARRVWSALPGTWGWAAVFNQAWACMQKLLFSDG